LTFAAGLFAGAAFLAGCLAAGFLAAGFAGAAFLAGAWDGFAFFAEPICGRCAGFWLSLSPARPSSRPAQARLLLFFLCVFGRSRSGGGGGCFRRASQLFVLEAEIVIELEARAGEADPARPAGAVSLARHAFGGPERVVEIVLGDVQRNVHRGRDLADEEVARVVIQLALLGRQRAHPGQRVQALQHLHGSEQPPAGHPIRVLAVGTFQSNCGSVLGLASSSKTRSMAATSATLRRPCHHFSLWGPSPSRRLPRAEVTTSQFWPAICLSSTPVIRQMP